jgi:hypothetical protein
VLVELGVVEQRYRAVLEVLDEGVQVTVVAQRYGYRTRRCMSGCAGMRARVWGRWRTGRRGGRRRGSSAGTGEIPRDVGDILYLRH